MEKIDYSKIARVNGYLDCLAISVKAVCEKKQLDFSYIFMQKFYFDFLEEGDTILSRMVTGADIILNQYPLNINHDLYLTKLNKNEEGNYISGLEEEGDAVLIGAFGKDIPWVDFQDGIIEHFFVATILGKGEIEIIDPFLDLKMKSTLADIYKVANSLSILKIKKIPKRSLEETKGQFLLYLKSYQGDEIKNPVENRVEHLIRELEQGDFSKEMLYVEGDPHDFDYNLVPIIRKMKSFSNDRMQVRDFLVQIEKEHHLDLSGSKEKIVTLSSMWKKEIVLYIMHFTKEDRKREPKDMIRNLKKIFIKEIIVLNELIDIFLKMG